MKKISFVLIILTAVLTGSCKKDVVKKVRAAFEASTLTPVLSEDVNFTNQSENASYYQWDFGDGNVSVDENPTHRYDLPGNFKVVLKAIGGDNSDTTSAYLNVVVPTELVTIHEGTGITGLSLLDDTWSDMRDARQGSDTLFNSQYLTDYQVYLNQVYYKAEGVVGVFFSAGDSVVDDDPLIGMIIVPPYPGFTQKSIGIGSSMQAVKSAYGTAEYTDDTDQYYGYSYSSLGIDFYAYKSIDANILVEIDIYPPSVKAAGLKADHIDFRKYINRSAFRR